METFNIISSKLTTTFEMKDANVIVMGSYNEDAVTKTVQDINGSVYVKTQDGGQGQYIGNFNGFMRDGGMRYSISEMTHAQSQLVWTAIEEIEEEIFKEDE